MKPEIFLSTKPNTSVHSYFFAAICMKHKINNDILYYNCKLTKDLKISNIFTLLKVMLSGNFFNDYKFIKLKLNNCEIGRHVLSQVHSVFKTNNNYYLFFIHKVTNLLKGIMIISFLEENKKKIKILYADQGSYLNGIYFNFFKNRNIFIYSINHPRGFFGKNLKKEKKNLSVEDYLKVNKKNISVSNKEKNTLKKKLGVEGIKNVARRSYLPWMINKVYKKINIKNIDEYEYLIYGHAFTDAQYVFGYDGTFLSAYEWLEFTIDFLLKENKKIIVKAHPNFNKFNKHFRSKYEVKLFNKIEKKFNNSKNVLFIADPIKNIEMLSLLNKKTILVTHHGTPVIEGGFSKFKFICSNQTYWSEKFRICNYWSNIEEYKKLLKSDYNMLKHSNTKDLFQLAKQVFFNNFNDFGNNFYVKKFEKFSGKNWINLMSKKNNLINYNPKIKKHKNFIYELKKSIEII